MQITYHDDLKEVQADPLLHALLSAPAVASPFDRLDWWRNLSETCDILPLIAVAREGTACAVLPLMRKGRQVHCLANWYSFRVAPLFTDGAERPALLKALCADLAGETPHLVLTALPNEQGEAEATADALRASGWRVFVEPCDVNHVFQVKDRSFADYMASRPGQVRSTLKRRGDKVTTSIECAFNPQSWADYEAVYAQSWKPQEGSPAFLRRFAQEEGAAGRLRLAIARAEGEPVAAQFWTVEGGTAFIHKLAHTEASKPLSPGTTLTAALMERVIDTDGVSLIDFGTGNDGYKRDWMDDVRPRYRIEAFRMGWPGNWPLIARKLLSRLAGRANHG